MPVYIVKKINGDTNQPTDQPTNRANKGPFQKLEKRKKAEICNFAEFLLLQRQIYCWSNSLPAHLVLVAICEEAFHPRLIKLSRRLSALAKLGAVPEPFKDLISSEPA